MNEKEILEFHKSATDLILKNYQLKYFPIGIKFIKSDESVFGFSRSKQRKPICAFIKIAAQDSSFYIDKNCISCPGGLKWMGFPSKLTKTYFYKYFLGKIEKIKSSPEIAGKFVDSLPEPPKEGLYQKIIFAPLKNCQFVPDVIVLITTPRHAYNIIIATYRDEYRLVKTIPICAACHGVISIPFTTGELNLSMIDSMARELGGYKEDEVLIGIPYFRFNSLIKNIKNNSYKPYKKSIFVKLIKKIID